MDYFIPILRKWQYCTGERISRSTQCLDPKISALFDVVVRREKGLPGYGKSWLSIGIFQYSSFTREKYFSRISLFSYTVFNRLIVEYSIFPQLRVVHEQTVMRRCWRLYGGQKWNFSECRGWLLMSRTLRVFSIITCLWKIIPYTLTRSHGS